MNGKKYRKDKFISENEQTVCFVCVRAGGYECAKEKIFEG